MRQIEGCIQHPSMALRVTLNREFGLLQ